MPFPRDVYKKHLVVFHAGFETTGQKKSYEKKIPLDAETAFVSLLVEEQPSIE